MDTRISIALIVGVIIALIAAFTSSNNTYYDFTSRGIKKEISEERYKKGGRNISKKTTYNSTFILLGLIAGTAGGYLMYDQINELQQKTRRGLKNIRGKKTKRTDIT